MMKLYKIILLIMFSTLLVFSGCSDRGVNTDANKPGEIDEGSLVGKIGSHVFHQELLFQVNNEFQQMRLLGYAPKVSFPDNEFRRVPLLVLLAPQDGDENYYFRHGLKELADELISKEIIQPMAILCVPSDQLFGGYFFAGNSPAAGLYDDLIGGELIRFCEEEFMPFTLRTKEKRAIGGIGMGAYGAFRAAMLHDTTFSAVSGISGPLDFDGTDNNSGFIPLFGDVLAEQGITGQDLPLNYSFQGDWHLSRLFIGGGFAFSSNDTMYEYHPSVVQNNFLRVLYDLDVAYSLDNAVFPLDQAISIPNFDELPTPFDNAPDIRHRFYLPFDNAGNIVTPVWDLWLNNNLPNIFANHANAFDGVNIWIGNSSETTFGNYYDQTNSWSSTLKTAGVSVTNFDLVGYDGHPADKDQYLYDYLRELLIFHSDNFGN